MIALAVSISISDIHLKKAIVSVEDHKSKLERKIGLEYGYKCNNIIK